MSAPRTTSSSTPAEMPPGAWLLPLAQRRRFPFPKAYTTGSAVPSASSITKDFPSIRPSQRLTGPRGCESLLPTKHPAALPHKTHPSGFNDPQHPNYGNKQRHEQPKAFYTRPIPPNNVVMKKTCSFLLFRCGAINLFMLFKH